MINKKQLMILGPQYLLAVKNIALVLCPLCLLYRASSVLSSAHGSYPPSVWHYRLWSFKSRDTKLERFLHKNQHTQRKSLNFENWTNGEPQQLAKIRLLLVDYFILPLFLMPKLRSVAQNEWNICSFYFRFKNKRV